MSDDPTRLSDVLGDWRARAAKYAAVPAPDPPPMPDDAELDLLAAESAHALVTRRWHSVVPQEFHRADLMHFAGRAWLAEAEEWAHNPHGRNCVVVGPIGTGKSHLAAALVRPACQAGLDVHIVTAARMMDRLRPNGPDGYMEELCDVDRLVVDDVGQERMSEWTDERYDMLVDARRREQLPTIFTTNLVPEKLAEHVGPRCYSRMVGGALVVRLSGEDRRRS